MIVLNLQVLIMNHKYFIGISDLLNLGIKAKLMRFICLELTHSILLRCAKKLQDFPIKNAFFKKKMVLCPGRDDTKPFKWKSDGFQPV